jgi:hypothetical protein
MKLDVCHRLDLEKYRADRQPQPPPTLVPARRPEWLARGKAVAMRSAAAAAFAVELV